MSLQAAGEKEKASGNSLLSQHSVCSKAQQVRATNRQDDRGKEHGASHTFKLILFKVITWGCVLTGLAQLHFQKAIANSSSHFRSVSS